MTVIIFAVMNVGTQKERRKKVMTTIDELPEKQRKDFCDMIDVIVMNLDKDPELKEGFKFLNDLAYNRKISLYDLLLEVYEISELEDRLDDWEEKKDISDGDHG